MTSSKENNPSLAFRLLQIAFAVGLILLGIDKLGNLQMIDWTQYLSVRMQEHFGCNVTALFMWVGILELLLGVGVIFKPHVFSIVIAGFLFLVMLNFFAVGMHYDCGIYTGMLGLAAISLTKLCK